MEFKEKVLRIVGKIPKGEVLTYKAVAKLAGRPKAYRAVGNILNGNYNPKIPCHRVIRSNGKLGAGIIGARTGRFPSLKKKVQYNGSGNDIWLKPD